MCGKAAVNSHGVLYSLTICVAVGIAIAYVPCGLLAKKSRTASSSLATFFYKCCDEFGKYHCVHADYNACGLFRPQLVPADETTGLHCMDCDDDSTTDLYRLHTADNAAKYIHKACYDARKEYATSRIIAFFKSKQQQKRHSTSTASDEPEQADKRQRVA
ncbi:hypothetical protein JKP88DRAFT_277480 [Tribonema minus]|uniref:Uncharacterized protein n=1 Tax=Tribonema minus TaxID=303371 RepID=A0A835Z5V5_9STRA|nr:hypothetical protein JKP88DRAFT_277480 [Tribonema minus]